MDALSICGTPLAVLGQVLAPAALLDLDLLPEEVALEPISPPYKYLLVCKVHQRCPKYLAQMPVRHQISCCRHPKAVHSKFLHGGGSILHVIRYRMLTCIPGMYVVNRWQLV